jgi:hypothetical protein
MAVCMTLVNNNSTAGVLSPGVLIGLFCLPIQYTEIFITKKCAIKFDT